jgi:cytosine/adenosine deaminase-related metal-dependent hydrolase
LIRYLPDWVLPIDGPPIRHGWVIVDRGRIVALGHQESGRPGSMPGVVADRPLPGMALMPGLVNAHTHLELSYLRDEVPPASSFVTWVRSVMSARKGQPDPHSRIILDAVERGIHEALASGTAVVGDISNTLVTAGPLVNSPLAGVVFYELIRFSVPDAGAFVDQACRDLARLPSSDQVRLSLAAHAPYSVAPLLFREIRRAVDRDPFAPYSVHLSESEEEVQFVETSEGPWRAVLEELGVWAAGWTPPGGSPVQYLDENGFLGPRTLAVHGVQMTADDLARLVAHGATLVTCPRSNGHTGAGAPPLEDFYASGVRVAVGTDSLASSPDLNVFAELATMRALAPSVPAGALLESATRHGARALGFDAEYGTIEPGKRARLITVAVPPDVRDVEEYLVSGIQPEQIAWI